ncbi:MAG: adenylate/guanylate cyclase domain-containing protein [Spirochaetales bacterium]|nr:adenylate/guanylate cyclase domain-containing protein [Spirochaetales bacterium]
MSIRLKIILIVIPLLTATLLLTGFVAVFSAETGITKVAIAFLGFKAEELKKNADSQWNLLVTNNLTGNPEYVNVTKRAVQSFASSVIRSDTELIFALDSQGRPAMSTRSIAWKPGELDALNAMQQAKKIGWQSFELEGKPRVAQIFFFEPFKWYVVVSEEKAAFFQGVREINRQNYMILGGSLLFSFLLLLFFSTYLTRPIKTMVRTMREIMHDKNLERRVEVEFPDEIGRMAATFNLMLAELERAYGQIKNFAYQSVLAKKTEQKIRNIFQKYVPADVIDEVLGNPESMLTGENRSVAILFSDIRGFTTISESMRPDELVLSLNRYFSLMVDIIAERNGTVDKYIGDAIMAIFGAPLRSGNDSLLAVIAGLEMQEALGKFNLEQAEKGKKEFRIGVGINYGEVTVGNIGSEKKMNYTVIGDNVNLASRLEGLTKKYQTMLLFSESVYQKVGRYVMCRMVDKVVVKGKSQGESIYTASKLLNDHEKRGWATWHSGLAAYYNRDFKKAKQLFLEVAERWLPEDYLAQEFALRAEHFAANPPEADWIGMEIMHEK